MSQGYLSSFNWPTAAPGAPGAPNLPKFTLDQGSAGSTGTNTAAYLMTIPSSIRPVSTDVPSSVNTVHITVASTVAYGPAADTSAASLIYQTKPLDLHAPAIPTIIRSPVPDMTVTAFELYTPSAEVTPTELKSGPTPNPSPSDTHNDFAPDHTSAKIAGVVAGVVAIIVLIGLAFVLRGQSRSHHKDSKSAPADTEAALEVKRQRAQHLGLNRWSRQDTEGNLDRFRKLKADVAAKDAAEKEDAIVEEVEGTVFVVGDEVQEPQMQYERARGRASGLAMHPPTPVEAVSEGDAGNCVGRAL